MEPSGWLTFDVNAVADALEISVDDVQTYFTDGRRVSFLIERRAVEAMPGSELAPNEGAGFDLIDSEGGYWEVRSLTRGGIYFCPSYMVGSGRSFEEDGFLDKLENIDGYFVTDVTQFPEMPYWIIESNIDEYGLNEGVLGNSSKVSKSKFLNLIVDV